MDFMTFMGNLKTHEMELKAPEELEPEKECFIQGSTSKKPFTKSTMKTTWDISKTESDEEVDTNNMCFIAGTI